MKTHQKYIYEGQDLTLDDVTIDEPINDTPPALQPTQEMQERFLRNCVDLGILKIVTIN